MRAERESGGAVHSTTTNAATPSNGFGSSILLDGRPAVKRDEWHQTIDLCLDLENMLDLRISRLMLIRERVLAMRGEVERIVFAVEEGVLP